MMSVKKALYNSRVLLPKGLRRKLKALLPSIHSNLLLKQNDIEEFYREQDDSLHFGKAIFPMTLISSPESWKTFSYQYNDFVYNMTPCTEREKLKKPVDIDGPAELGEVRLNDGDVVFDCGASGGVFSAMTANYNCTCYAFEPLPVNISILEELQKVNPHIIIAPYAVSDADGTVRFSDSNDATLYSAMLSDDSGGV